MNAFSYLTSVLLSFPPRALLLLSAALPMCACQSSLRDAFSDDEFPLLGNPGDAGANANDNNHNHPPTNSGNPFPIDDTDDGPQLVNSKPAPGAANVAAEMDLTLRFDEPIEKGAGAIRLFDGLSGAEVEAADVGGNRVAINDDEVVIDWTQTLVNATGYSVQIDSGAFVNRAGKAFAGLTDPSVLTFTTAPPPPVTLTTTLPQNGAADVFLEAQLVLVFSERVLLGQVGNITVFELDTGTLAESVPVSDESSVRVDEEVVTVTLSTPLVYGTTYFVMIDAGAFISERGAPFAGIRTDNDFAFTTHGPPELELVGTLPMNNSTGVDPAASLVFTFSEAVDPGDGLITVHRADDDTVVDSAHVSDENVFVSNVTVTFDASADLDTATEYYVTVDPGTVKSTLGASFAGLLEPAELTFTTASTALTPVTLVSLFPADGATAVGVDTQLVLQFSEPVSAVVGNISLFDYERGSLVAAFDVASASVVSVDGDTVTVRPPTPLEGDTTYYVTISAGSFASEQGASFAGITDTESWNFTAERTFGIADLSPPDGATTVGQDANLVITFNENVVVGDGVIELYAATGDHLIERIPLSNSRVNIEGAIVTIDPDSLLASESKYYVLIEPGTFQEPGAGDWAGIADPMRWTFTTETVAFPGAVGNGLVLWVDATLATSIKQAAGVRLWADRSGRQNDLVQASENSRPALLASSIGGNPTVSFDGEDDWLALEELLPLTAFDGFMVWRSPDTPGNTKTGMIANGKNFEVNHGHTVPKNTLSSCFGDLCESNNSGWSGVAFVPVPAANTAYLWNFGFNAITTSLSVRAQGGAAVVQSGPTQTPVDPSAPLSLGACPDGTCAFRGEFGELLLYSRVLSASERIAVASYLRAKWGLPEPACGSDESRGPNGSCYFVSTDTVDWDTARTNCQARGAGWDLVTVRSEQEHAFLIATLTADTWIGGADGAVDGTWRWVTDTLQFWNGAYDGTPSNGAVTFWRPGPDASVAEPTGGPEFNCLRYANYPEGFAWADQRCSSQYVYACEGPGD